MENRSISKLIRSLLSFAKEERIMTHEIAEKARVPIETVVEMVKRIAKQDLLKIENEEIVLSSEQRLNLALEAIRIGIDPESICKELDWQEFEKMASLFLRENGYLTIQNLHFTASGRKWEIDVLGLNNPMILAIDCKHWKRSWQKIATQNMVKAQIKRARLLAILLPELREKLKIHNWKLAEILPIILTLHDAPFKTFLSVPVVSIFRFQNFLLELHANIQSLNSIRIKIPAVTDWV
jgi:hypothetical protein